MKHLLVYKYYDDNEHENRHEVVIIESENELHKKVNDVTVECQGKFLEILFAGAVLHEYEYNPVEYVVKMKPKRKAL
jgi:hypothetical protein